MEAWIERSGDVVVVHLKGRVDYDSFEPFRQHCVSHLLKEKVIFNLKDLAFVGSIGITDFVETMTHMSKASTGGIKFASVGSEFRRIFEASEIVNLAIYDSTVRAFQGLGIAPLPSIASLEGPRGDESSGLG